MILYAAVQWLNLYLSTQNIIFILFYFILFFFFNMKIKIVPTKTEHRLIEDLFL